VRSLWKEKQDIKKDWLAGTAVIASLPRLENLLGKGERKSSRKRIVLLI